MNHTAANFEIALAADEQVWLTAGDRESRVSIDFCPRDEVYAELADFLGDHGIVDADGCEEHGELGDGGGAR